MRGYAPHTKGITAGIFGFGSQLTHGFEASYGLVSPAHRLSQGSAIISLIRGLVPYP